jgi:hypothetical protein
LEIITLSEIGFPKKQSIPGQKEMKISRYFLIVAHAFTQIRFGLNNPPKKWANTIWKAPNSTKT